MTTATIQIEYALMVDHEDGHPAEFIPAESAGHALQMARTLYGAYATRVVGREVQPWRYARPLGTELGEVVDHG